MRPHVSTVLTGLVIFLAGIAVATKRLAPECTPALVEAIALTLGFALFAEVAAHRKTRRSAGMLAGGFKDNPIATIVTRARNHEIVAVNSAYEKMLGWRAEDSVGKTAVDLRVFSIHTRNDLTRMVQLGCHVSGHFDSLRTRGGNHIPVSISKTLFEVDGETYSVMTFVDEQVKKQDEAKATAFRVALRPPTTLGLPELVAADGTGPITVPNG
jgi:PAS domain S-box-containing protein